MKRLEKQKTVAERWAMMKWVTEFLKENFETWEKEKEDREKRERKELEEWERTKRLEKVRILKEKLKTGGEGHPLTPPPHMNAKKRNGMYGGKKAQRKK